MPLPCLPSPFCPRTAPSFRAAHASFGSCLDGPMLFSPPVVRDGSGRNFDFDHGSTPSFVCAQRSEIYHTLLHDTYETFPRYTSHAYSQLARAPDVFHPFICEADSMSACYILGANRTACLSRPVTKMPQVSMASMRGQQEAASSSQSLARASLSAGWTPCLLWSDRLPAQLRRGMQEAGYSGGRMPA